MTKEQVTTVEGEETPSEREVPVFEFFHWIYRFFYSKTLGVILILVFAAFAVVGSLIHQAGPITYQDPAAKEAFLQEMQGAYGGWTPILNALGFFHVFTSIPFYITVVLLGLSIAACTIHRIPELIRRQNDPRVHVARRFFDRARYRACVVTEVPAGTALETAKDVMKKQRFRVLPDPRDEDAFYADRNAWAGIGTVISHVSFIVILLAFVVSANWGVEENLAVPVGEHTDVGLGTGLTATALYFQNPLTEEGQPADYVSGLELWDGDTLVAEQDVRVNDPLDYGGFRYHQATFGLAADMTVTRAGETLFEGPVPMSATSNEGQNIVGQLDIPESDVEAIVVASASGASHSEVPIGAVLVQIYDQPTGEMLDRTIIWQGDTERLGEYRFTFERERQYTGITVRNDPGTLWMWIGSTLLVVGMSITFLFPYRRLWGRVDDDQDARRLRLGAVARLDYSYQRLFERLVDQVETSLNEDEDG